jgi:hypothetical protein
MIVAVVGAALLVIGSFLTWATVSIDLGKFAAALGVDEATLGAAIAGPTEKSASGLSDGADGIFTLIAGLIVIGLAFLLRAKPASRKPIGLGMALAGLIGAGVAFYDISQVNDVRDEALGGMAAALAGTGLGADVLDGVVNVSTGIGIWICVVGGVVAIVAGLMTAFAAGSTLPAMATDGMATGAPSASSDLGFGTPAAPTPAAPTPAAPAPAAPMPDAGGSPMPEATAPVTEAPPPPPVDPAPTEGGGTDPA